jgi:hypothetical protein
MDRESANSLKTILGWTALAFCLLLAAWCIKSAFWVSPQPVSISSWHQFKYTSYAVALLIIGIALFGGIRSLPDFGRVRLWLVIVPVLYVIGLTTWEYLAVQPPEEGCPEVPSTHPVCTDGGVVVPCHEAGDVNGDEEVNSGDLVVLQQLVLGIKCPDIHTPFGDMNQDGQINVADILLLEKALLGL